MENNSVLLRVEEIKIEIKDYKDLILAKDVPQDEKDFAKGLIIDLDKELISLYKEMGEVKTDIFYNPLIFVEEADYILGGFTKNELNEVKIVGDDTAISFPKLEHIFDKRLIKAIEQANEENEDLPSLLENYLELSKIESSNGDVFNIIKEHSSYQYWLNDIREKLIEYKSKETYSKDNVNENLPSNVELADAEELTNTATLIDMLGMLMNKNQLK